MVTRSNLLLLLLSGLGLWLLYIRVAGIVLNLRAYEFVTQGIREAQVQAAAAAGVEIVETFYTRNVSYEEKGALQRFVLNNSRWLDPAYPVGYLIYWLFFRGKPFSDVQYVIPEELPRGNTL